MEGVGRGEEKSEKRVEWEDVRRRRSGKTKGKE